MEQLTKIATSIIDFINNVAVPLVFAVAFIVFIFGVFRYFIAGGANPEKRKEGGQLIMYSVIGFAVMIAIWGLVNLIVNTFGFDSKARPDLPTFGAPSNSTTGAGSSATNSAQPTGNTLVSPATQQFLDQQAQIEAQKSPSPQPAP